MLTYARGGRPVATQSSVPRLPRSKPRCDSIPCLLLRTSRTQQWSRCCPSSLLSLQNATTIAQARLAATRLEDVLVLEQKKSHESKKLFNIAKKKQGEASVPCDHNSLARAQHRRREGRQGPLTLCTVCAPAGGGRREVVGDHG